MTSSTHQSRQLLSTWGVSFCIHAIVLASAAALLHDLPRLQPPAYRMEFLLTDPTSALDAVTSQEAPTATEHSSPAAPSPSRSTSIVPSPHVIEQPSLTETSIVQPIVNPVTPPAVEQREMSPSATASDSIPVKSPTPIERHVDTLPPMIESRNPPTINTSQPVERPLMTVSAQVAATPATEPVSKNLQEDVPHAPLASSLDDHSPSQSTSQSSSTASLTRSGRKPADAARCRAGR